METKDILLKIRKENNLSQEEFAQKLFVTRQAISRWERGITTPNNETLITISKMFNISVNALLGDTDVFCQSCGMPLSKEIMSHEKDGKTNEDYCMWCYKDGKYTYESVDELIKKVVPILVQKGFNEEQARSYMQSKTPTLRHWKENH